MNQLETSSAYWASVRQHHDEFVELAVREMRVEATLHPVEAETHRVLQDMPAIGDDAEVAVRVLS